MVDNEALRDLLVFISADLTDKDIPHRSMLSKLIVENFQREYVRLQEEIQVSPNSLIINSSLTYFPRIPQAESLIPVMFGHEMICLRSWPSLPIIW